MVHSSQVSTDLSFSREDEDDMKVKSMDFYAPAGSEVGTSPDMLEFFVCCPVLPRQALCFCRCG